MIVNWIGALLCIALVGASAHATVQDAEPAADDLIHSDLPLFGDDFEQKWPRGFTGGDGGFGCESRVQFGDWRLSSRDSDDQGEATWLAIRNYGVFHCFAAIGTASERDELAQAPFDYGFFIELGTIDSGTEWRELWALQIGSRPRSEYILLERPNQGDGPVEMFTVLQRDCPPQNVRDAGQMSILVTRYCAINSRGELMRLARRMAARPPLGTLHFVANAAAQTDLNAVRE